MSLSSSPSSASSSVCSSFVGDDHHNQHQDQIEESETSAMYSGQMDARSPRSRHRDIFTPRSSRHSKCASCGSSADGHQSSRDGALSPSLLSSPSIASSISFTGHGSVSPLRRQLSHSTLLDDDEHIEEKVVSHRKRQDLAKRLTLLGQRLSCGEDIDGSALVRQVEQLEKTLSPPASPRPTRQRSYDMRSPYSPDGLQNRSEMGSALGSPISLMLRSQISDLSIESMREQERERERRLDEEENRPKMGMTVQQANKVIAEAEKLNDEMQAVVNNLRARQEEADHINALLIERAERAAQRIVFLQNRISYLEQELFDNDDELQHLRICLKAVEVQLPPHPDKELQRCINVFKQDYNTLKQKRIHRSSTNTTVMATTPDSTQSLAFTPPTSRRTQSLYG